METIRTGTYEVRFPSHRRREADIVAVFLPTVRAKAGALLGWRGEHAVRVVLAENAPRLRDVVRLDPHTLAFWATLPVALLIFGLLSHTTFIAEVAGWALALLVAMHVGPVLVMWRAWPSAAGLALCCSPRQGGGVVLLNLAPLPVPPETAALRNNLLDDDRLRAVAAHEYAHIALHDLYRSARIPPWLDEGVADWFSEKVAGAQYWRLESRACVDEPEPRRDPRWRMAGNQKQRESYYRLAARYYWEVQHLAQAGRIRELLATPLKRTRTLRPSPDQVRAGWQQSQVPPAELSNNAPRETP